MDSLHGNSLPTYATPFPTSTLTSGSSNTFKVSAAKAQEETNLWFPTMVEICTNGISCPNTQTHQHQNMYALETLHILRKKIFDEHVLGFCATAAVDQFAILACFKGHKAF